MNIPRLYSGEDGQSHWGEIELEMESATFSRMMNATGIQLGNSPARRQSDWHNAPRRQFVVILTGEVDFEIGDGSKRHFAPGDIFLAEDLVGQGHRGQTGSELRTTLYVPLAK